MNQPWECPRCTRINASWNPACFCKEEKKSSYLQALEEKIVKRDTCKVCNRIHSGDFPCGYLEII